jgi:hypothetical protein
VEWSYRQDCSICRRNWRWDAGDGAFIKLRIIKKP